MALSKKSLEQAKQVLQQIMHSNVDVIFTRATLDKKIELVKFPYLYDSHMKNPQNRTLYVSQQYDPIRYWLINNKFLTSSRDVSGRYQYRVNRETISLFFATNSRAQSNNTKNPDSKVMTKREKIFRHIEDNGNAMRYTDIIKFAYELTHGKGSFDKKANRGYYSGAFTFHSYFSWLSGDKYKKVGAPKGHFVIPTRNGNLVKLPTGLWSVVRPSNFIRKTYDTILVPDVSSNTPETCVPKEEYNDMCNTLKKYNIKPFELDQLATKYWSAKQCDVDSAYHFAYYDLLEKGGSISDATKDLQKEIDALADRIIAEDKKEVKYQKYVVISIADNYHEGIFTASELETFFTENDPEDYMIIEAGNMVTLEKKVTTTFTIK
jgi:hypothetical protein